MTKKSNQGRCARMIDAILSRISKPSKYLGNEVFSIKKDFDKGALRVALIFPDDYEIGMSHVGLKILYKILNDLPDVVAERVFAPGLDLEKILREEKIPLFSLESKRPLRDFDVLGFSFTYELTYTNFLNILDLAQIPLWQKDRDVSYPLILGGGGCMMNAEPIADFLDAAALGDGEDLILDIVQAVRKWKAEPNNQKNILLDRLSQIEGIYVPSFFEPEYEASGGIKKIHPLKANYLSIKKRVYQDLDKAPYPTSPVIPSVQIVHDRIGIEIQRGCNRACRFCQAGYIDRPVRQRSPETVLKIAEETFKNTGINEISLLSLSAADYGCIVDLTRELNKRFEGENVSISVPATRTEKLTPELIEQIKKVRKTGFTIAPEAGSARMRRVINKGNEVEDLYRAVTNAFSQGWDLLKLYYMSGLPFETDEDILGISEEANASIKICKRYSKRSQLNLSISSFVPKPHTPFQWEPQMTVEETKRKYALIRRALKDPRIRFKSHHPEMSLIEGIFSRGDRRVGGLLYLAFKEGCRFDEWEEHFDFSKWETAMEKWDHDIDFYLHRKRAKEEVLPWDHLFSQMDKGFLWDELEKAHDVAVGNEGGSHRLKPREQDLLGFTEDCSVDRCSNCGVCDFREIKNRIFVTSEEKMVVKKGHREWMGWVPQNVGARFIAPKSEGTMNGAPTENKRIRTCFSKTGVARFMGHLELMTSLRRAILRCRIPVSYSQGFHPQMKLAMGFPLPLGIESQGEYFDLDLIVTQPIDDFIHKLNASLPSGITILSAEFIDTKGSSLYSQTQAFSYTAFLDGTLWPEQVSERIQDFKQRDFFYWRREDRKKDFDLRECVEWDSHDLPRSLAFRTRLTNEGSVRPLEVFRAVLSMSEEQLSLVRLIKTRTHFSSSFHPAKSFVE